MNEITKGLFELQDTGYRDFHAGLIPNIPYEKIIGVRTPQLRRYAKEAAKRDDVYDFLSRLPHDYYEENNLHGELLKLLYKDLYAFLEQLEIFLPYIDNWATCDMLSPKVFRKDLPFVCQKIKEWLGSDKTYTVRFAVVTLLQFFLGEQFTPGMLELVAAVGNEEYYVRMAVAWYFSMALVKQYDAAVTYFETQRLDNWTHNKAIQKAVESRQIDAATKTYLKSLKVK